MKERKIAIETNNLSKRYGFNKEYALKNANIKVYEGDFHGLIGRNGAGKTTLIKLLVGALERSKGTSKIFEYDTKKVEAKKYFGYVPEIATFQKGIFETVEKILRTQARLNGYRNRDIMPAINKVIDTMQIDDLRKKRPFDFSSGQKKKVLIAQALIKDPKVLILDEPASNLDPTARKQILDKLKMLSTTRKLTILISSHILTELQKYATGWTIIKKGEIKANDSYGAETSFEKEVVLETSDNKIVAKEFEGHEMQQDIPGQIIIKLKHNESEQDIQRKIFNLPIKIYSFEKNHVSLKRLFEELVGYGD